MTRDLLAAGRIANLPTVWTNVLVGAALAKVRDGFDSADVVTVGLVMITGALLYVSGCFYNDYHDRHWDAEHKPERAIPSGRLSATFLKKLILIFGGVGIILSFCLGIASGIVSLVVIAFIVLYTRIHKRTVFAIIPMGLCRAGLYFLGFVSMRTATLEALPAVIVPAFGLISYIAGITLVARSEATNTLPAGAKWLGLGLLPTPLFTHTLSLSSHHFVYLVLGVLALFCLNKLVERSVGGFVSLCLAGICLVDGFLLSSLGATSIWITVLVSASGFILSRLLQKIAPAT